jgi:hypothetical protein
MLYWSNTLSLNRIDHARSSICPQRAGAGMIWQRAAGVVKVGLAQDAEASGEAEEGEGGGAGEPEGSVA